MKNIETRFREYAKCFESSNQPVETMAFKQEDYENFKSVVAEFAQDGIPIAWDLTNKHLWYSYLSDDATFFITPYRSGASELAGILISSTMKLGYDNLDNKIPEDIIDDILSSIKYPHIKKYLAKSIIKRFRSGSSD